MGIHHYKRVIAIRVSLILVKCNSRDSRIIHLTWTFGKVSLCEFLFLLLIPGTCWEFTYGELIWLKWCTIQAQWRNSTGWLSPSNISPPMLKGEVVHPLYHSCTHFFAYLARALVLVRSLQERIQATDPAANYLTKRNWLFCQDRSKVDSVKSFTSYRANTRMQSWERGQG